MAAAEQKQPGQLVKMRGDTEVAVEGIDALQKIVRENDRLKAESEGLRSENAHIKGTIHALQIENQRLSRDRDHYRQRIVTMGTVVESAHHQMERLFHSMPPLEPEDVAFDQNGLPINPHDGADQVARKFAAKPAKAAS